MVKNHENDYLRRYCWAKRIKLWEKEDFKNNFIVHQNVEVASPLLSAYIINNLNAAIGNENKINR